MTPLFALFRTLIFATVGFTLLYLPARVLSASGIVRPAAMGGIQIVGLVVATLGTVLLLWCALDFALIGRGTPAPFDPPRKLVTQGPYRFVRNPMYIGAVTLLSGAALFYQSKPLLIYECGFLILCHLFVVIYEEPALARKFGEDYESYRRHVHRWRPGRPWISE
jgi:protein-S-isoprenylcysteine O-methyltransferase Ste14